MDINKLAKISLSSVIQKIIDNYRQNIHEKDFEMDRSIEVIINKEVSDVTDYVTIADVAYYINHIDGNYILTYEKQITVYEKALDLFVKDFYETCEINNNQLISYIYYAVLEDYILHEFRHINQFKTLEINVNNINTSEIYDEDFNKIISDGFSLNNETINILEKDARDFTLKIGLDGVTVLDNYFLKKCLLKMHYNAQCGLYIENDLKLRQLGYELNSIIKDLKILYIH